jgi:hypothetical protein
MPPKGPRHGTRSAAKGAGGRAAPLPEEVLLRNEAEDPYRLRQEPCDRSGESGEGWRREHRPRK